MGRLGYERYDAQGGDSGAVVSPELARIDAELVVGVHVHGCLGFPSGAPGVRRIAEREHNVVHWTEFDRGGHFPAMEVPDLLVDDVRAFFALVR